MKDENRIFYGWWIVAATFIILFIGLCSGFYTVSVFLEPLQAAFNCTKTEISLGFTIAALLVGMFSPVAGIAVGRFGAKNVQLSGALIGGISLLLMGSMQHLWHYYALFIFLAMGLGLVGVIPSQTVISCWFNKKRGLAMGIIMTGIGLGGMSMVFLANQAVAELGWRWAYRILGLSVLCLVLPVILLVMKNRPEDMGLSQDGEVSPSGNEHTVTPDSGFTVSQAAVTSAFYHICFIMALYSFILGGMTQHAIALLKNQGAADAGLFWSLTLGASVIGRIIFGGLADRISKKILIIIIWIFHFLGLSAILYLPSDGSLIWGFVFFYGIALGSFPTLLPLIMGEKFGIENFSKFIGIAGVFQVAGLSTGSVLLGRIVDTSGSYGDGIRLFLIVSVAAILFTALIGKPKHPGQI